MTMVGGVVEWCSSEADALCPQVVPLAPEADGPVTASAAIVGNPPEAAFDGDTETVWNSGQFPIQWIEIDLGAEIEVKAVRLTIAQDPAGATTHVISGRSDSGPAVILSEHAADTRDGEVIEVVPDSPWTGIRYLRVETTGSPSWVAWREIELVR